MISLSEFQDSLQKRLKAIFHQTIEKSLAEEQGLIAKHFNLEVEGYGLKLMRNNEVRLKIPKCQKRRTLTLLAILSWYLPDLTRFELQEYLRRKAVEHEFYFLSSYLRTLELMIYSLYREYDFTRSDLFGNILVSRSQSGRICPSGTGNSLKIFVYLQAKRPEIRAQRKRGYTDRGSTADISTKARREADMGTYEEQLEIENERSKRSLRFSNLFMERELERLQGI